jgi:hypothetical protein
MKAVLLAVPFILLALPSARSRAESPPQEAPKPDNSVRAFLTKHCQECHSGEKPKGHFSLDKLRPDFDGAANRERWLAVLNRVRAGEMPPKAKPRPAKKDVEALAGWIDAQAGAARLARGRTVLRRLNRIEYQNTVRDLLGIEVDFQEMLPADSSANGHPARPRFRFAAAVKAIQHRHQVAIQQQRHQHAAHNHDGQRPLRLRANLGGQRRRQQAEDCRQGRHKHRPHFLGRPHQNGIAQSHALGAQGVEVRDRQQTVHDGHAEHRNEADRRRDAEVVARQYQRPDAAHAERQYVHQHHERIRQVAESQKEENENQYERQRHDPRQPAERLLHFLELAAPLGPVRRRDEVARLLLPLRHGAGQVALAPVDAELDGDEPIALFARDR